MFLSYSSWAGWWEPEGLAHLSSLGLTCSVSTCVLCTLRSSPPSRSVASVSVQRWPHGLPGFDVIPWNASDKSPLLVLIPKDGKPMITPDFVTCYHNSVCVGFFFFLRQFKNQKGKQYDTECYKRYSWTYHLECALYFVTFLLTLWKN